MIKISLLEYISFSFIWIVFSLYYIKKITREIKFKFIVFLSHLAVQTLVGLMYYRYFFEKDYTYFFVEIQTNYSLAMDWFSFGMFGVCVYLGSKIVWKMQSWNLTKWSD